MSSPTAREVSTALGREDTGVTAGTQGGAPIGSEEQRAGLSTEERRRLLEAVRQVFDATATATAALTVVPKDIDAEPTSVSATTAGPLESRADGSTCRPIALSATKNARTTIATLTFCRAPGSRELTVATTI